MCLNRVDSKPMRKCGIGYKMVRKTKGKYSCYDYMPKAGTVQYPLNKWLADKNKEDINMFNRMSYPAGFHISLDKKEILKCVKINLKGYSKDVVAIKVRFKKVVATNMRRLGIVGIFR